jgi:hypothetical protein
MGDNDRRAISVAAVMRNCRCLFRPTLVTLALLLLLHLLLPLTKAPCGRCWAFIVLPGAPGMAMVVSRRPGGRCQLQFSNDEGCRRWR